MSFIGRAVYYCNHCGNLLTVPINNKYYTDNNEFPYECPECENPLEYKFNIDDTHGMARCEWNVTDFFRDYRKSPKHWCEFRRLYDSWMNFDTRKIYYN